MAISFVASTQNTTGTGTALSISGTLPTGLLSGDLLLLFLFKNRNETVTTPAGWTLRREVTDAPSPPAAAHLLIYSRAATGSDASPTFTVATANRMTTIAAAYRGASTSTPFVAENGQAQDVSSTGLDAPAVTNTDANAWAVFAGGGRNLGSPVSGTPPTGLVERADVDAGDASNTNLWAYLADSNGPVATGVKTYVATISKNTATAVAWTGFLQAAAASKVGTATGSWSVTASATGVSGAVNNAVGSWSVTGTATGSRASQGGATGSWSVTATALGRTQHRGSAGSHTVTDWNDAEAWTDAAAWPAPTVVLEGHTWTGTATSAGIPKGSTSGFHSWSGTAAGLRTSRGAATGSHSWSGTALGTSAATATPTLGAGQATLLVVVGVASLASNGAGVAALTPVSAAVATLSSPGLATATIYRP